MFHTIAAVGKVCYATTVARIVCIGLYMYICIGPNIIENPFIWLVQKDCTCRIPLERHNNIFIRGSVYFPYFAIESWQIRRSVFG